MERLRHPGSVRKQQPARPAVASEHRVPVLVDDHPPRTPTEPPQRLPGSLPRRESELRGRLRIQRPAQARLRPVVHDRDQLSLPRRTHKLREVRLHDLERTDLTPNYQISFLVGPTTPRLVYRSTAAIGARPAPPEGRTHPEPLATRATFTSVLRRSGPRSLSKGRSRPPSFPTTARDQRSGAHSLLPDAPSQISRPGYSSMCFHRPIVLGRIP